MKTKILALSLLSVSAYAQVNIQGEVKNTPAKKVYLQEFKDKIFYTIDSAEVKGGKFTFSKNLHLPEVYGLTLQQDKSPVFLYLDEKDSAIEVLLDSSSYYANTKFTGSSAQDIFEKYKKAGRDFELKSFLQAHPNSIVSAYILYRNFAYRLEAEEIRTYLSLLAPNLQASPYGKNLQAYLQTLETLKIGQKAPDFIVADTEGKPLKFSDHWGKYVLLDFWAAWCGPCRMMEPVLKEIAGENMPGLTIGQLNVDENPQTAMKFEVMSIPTFLIFKDGVQVKRLTGAMPKAKLVDEIKTA